MSRQELSGPADGGWRFDNSYARLPESFYVRLSPAFVRAPRLALCNRELAAELGLDAVALESHAGVEMLAGNCLPPGAEPIAQAYSGHQFGYFARLGDGRALLLGEQITPDGRRVDIQLKGSGRTPFSRRGDGRAALGPMLREFIISEAMYAFGIPTTRSLAVVMTGETVHRETALPGAILTRVASSHLRVGTFEHFAAQGDGESVRMLARYAIQRHFPDCAAAENPWLALLEAVIARQAALIARWQLVGFIHGVMNTDNMAISGETIDYGPCAFMDAYDPATVFSSIDHQGRYAYGNQPLIAQWNLARFAETLLPLLHAEPEVAVRLAESAISAFADLHAGFWLAGMREKLGLITEEAGDRMLAEDLLGWMQRNRADYTNTFRALDEEPPPFADAEFLAWHQRWQERLARQPNDGRQRRLASNPAIIPRNHQVETALAAAEAGDWKVLDRLRTALAQPWENLPEYAAYRSPPAPDQRVYQTFCGT